MNKTLYKRALEYACASRGLWLLFITAAFIRLLWLDSLPAGLNQDEASIAYDAWALLHYGIDRNGFSWPVNLVAWGSGQNVLYAYLSMPFIAVAGLSVLSTRLLAASAGLLVLWLFWQQGRRSDKEMAWCALLLVATSPWHIMATRWALESNILPALVLLAVFLLARSVEASAQRLPLAAGVLTLSIYAYGPAYLFAPLFLGCALVLVWRQQRFSWQTGLLALGVAGLLALPMAAFLLNNWLGTGSLHIGPISLPHYSGPARYSNIFLPFAENGWQRTLDNMAQVAGLIFAARDDGMPANAIPGWGAQYIILMPFVLWGIQHSMQRSAELIDRLMLAWLLCGLLTAFVTDANINRINLVWLPLLWMAARGLWLLRGVPFMLRGASALLLLCCALFCSQLFGPWRPVMAEAFFDGLNEAIADSLRTAAPDAPIQVTDHANMPYITALFAARTPPARFIETAQIPDRSAAFQGVLGFDRFRFGLDLNNLASQSVWVAHRSEWSAFDSDAFALRSFADYARVLRRPASAVACQTRIQASALQGSQDFGQLGEDGEVNTRGAGFQIGAQHWAAGLGTHGNSNWTYQSPAAMQTLGLGFGVSDNSQCSDGMYFNVLADGKAIFKSELMQSGKLQFIELDLAGAHTLTLQTDAGQTNNCDHGNWIRPVISACKP